MGVAMGYSGHTGPMPAVPRPPEEQALPEERRPAGKWWLAEEQGLAEQREPAETPRGSAEAPRRSAEAPRRSAEAPRRSAETQPLAVKRAPDEKWWLAEKQGA